MNKELKLSQDEVISVLQNSCSGQIKTTSSHPDIIDRIKTFEDACNELGDIHAFVVAFKVAKAHGAFGPDIIAYLKLRIIVAALNEGWEPQFTKDECRWYPLHYLLTESEIGEKSDKWKADHHLIMIGDKYQSEYAGLACVFSANAPSSVTANIGSHLCLKSKFIAQYCGRQFIDLWADFLLIKRNTNIGIEPYSINHFKI